MSFQKYSRVILSIGCYFREIEEKNIYGLTCWLLNRPVCDACGCWLWQGLEDTEPVDGWALDFKTNQCQAAGPRSHFLMRTPPQRCSHSSRPHFFLFSFSPAALPPSLHAAPTFRCSQLSHLFCVSPAREDHHMRTHVLPKLSVCAPLFSFPYIYTRISS